jgi:hypothetical protein
MPPPALAALEKTRATCLALPWAEEKISHGAPVFHVRGKLFVMFADHHHNDGRLALWCKATHEIQRVFVESDPDRFFVPPYVGPSGWVGVRVDRPRTDWRAIAEIIEESWRMVAPKKALPLLVSSARSALNSSKKMTQTPEIPARLFRVPAYLPYLQPPLTDEAVLEAESRLGVTLPRSYVAALKVQNGGYLRLSSHPSGHAPVDVLAGIGPRFPSLHRYDWSEVKQFMAEEGFTRPAHLDGLIPFCGDGHYHYCLDYRKARGKREPSVTYIDVEGFNVDEILAPDFATFLHQLRPGDPSEAYGLVTREPAETVASALSNATGVRFEDQGDQDNGYRVHRARLSGESAWAWLSQNSARRGFVRTSDPDYKKLRRTLSEEVDRYPEHPDCGFFLSCTDFKSKAGKAILRGLKDLPFETRKVSLDGS